MSQTTLAEVVDLVNLAPGLQERILNGEIAITERDLRGPLRSPLWTRQEEALVGRD